MQENGELKFREITPGYYDSNLVLEDYMGTPKVNPMIDGLESQALELIMEGEIEQAEQVISHLNDLTNGTSPVITKAQMLIYRKKNKIFMGGKTA